MALLAFAIKATTIKHRPLQLSLISRRSRHRAGTRYFRRGVDREGHVANFNETEQIVLFEPQSQSEKQSSGGGRLSFVQIRGSIPLYWAEVNNLRYKPELQVMELPDTVRSLLVHCIVMDVLRDISGRRDARAPAGTAEDLWASGPCQPRQPQRARGAHQERVRKVHSEGMTVIYPLL